MAKSKMISVRLDLEVAEELEHYSRGTRVSKNMIINRGTRLYVQLLQLLDENDANVISLIGKVKFKQLISEMITYRRIYWEL